MDQPRLRASRIRGLSGALLLGLGALLLAVSGAYYAYSVIAKSNLDTLTYSVERPSPPVPFSPSVSTSGDTQASVLQDASVVQAPSPGEGVLTGEVPGTDRGGAALAKVSRSGAAGAVQKAILPSGVSVAATIVVSEVNGGATRPSSPEATAQGQALNAAAQVAASKTASTAPVGEQQSEADAFASTDIGLQANGGADTPPSVLVSVEAQGATATGAEEEVMKVTSPVGVPLASVETGKPVPTVGTQGEDAGAELPNATSADVLLAEAGSTGVAGESVGSANDGIISTSEEVLSSEAGLTAVLSPVDTKDGVLSDDEQEMATYLDSEVRKAGLSSAEWAGLNAEVAKYSLPSSFDLNGARLSATRIRIPAIHLDSGVSELQVVLSDDQRVWDTPKWVVGHIPTTAQPGEQGQGWYFGHLESLIRGEGSIFRRLPEIPELLAEGEPIYVFLETADRKYLYQVYETDWVHQDDLRVVDSGQQDITLVTCYPRLIYDHRVLVTAALVGVSES